MFSHDLNSNKHLNSKANSGNENNELSIFYMEVCHTTIKEKSSKESNELENNYFIFSEVMMSTSSELNLYLDLLQCQKH